MIKPPRLYVYLDAVARAGSIRKAADKLNIASTALNRRILEFEGAIGSPLFERLPRGVRLTAAGEILIATIRRSLSDLTSAQSQIEQLSGLVRGTVRLACAESAANDLIPETINRYQERYPGVQFQLIVGSTAPLMTALLEDEVDLMLAHNPPLSDQISTLATIPQPLCAMMRPGHALARRTSMRLAECQPYPIALGPETFGSRKLINSVLAKSRLSLRVVMEASTLQPQKVFVRDTDAICFQYEIGTRREARSGELAVVRLDDPDLGKGNLVLASRTGRILPISAMSFVENLKAAMATAPAPRSRTPAQRVRSK